jgi:predicted transcriptional regulator
MASTTVRITQHTHQVLRELAKATGERLEQVLEEAVDRYRRERFLADLHVAYERLVADQAISRDELADRAKLDGTLADGFGEM